MLEAGLCAFAHDPSKRCTAERGTCCGGRRRAIRNSYRAGAFRNWLLETFGLEKLRAGYVLDVAGGKGELSFELANCVGVSHLFCLVNLISLYTSGTCSSCGPQAARFVGCGEGLAQGPI